MTNTQRDKFIKLKLSIYKRAFDANKATTKAQLNQCPLEAEYQCTRYEVLKEIIDEAGLTEEYEMNCNLWDELD